MADDLGFSELGCYGGEIETPNLDDLPLLQPHPISADANGVRPQGRLPKDCKAPVYGER